MPPHQPTPPNTRQPSKADKELLFKGVTCALIGLVIVLAPYIARSGDVRELMGQVAAVGWFALVAPAGTPAAVVQRLEQALEVLIDTDLTLRSTSRAPTMAVMERALIRLAMLGR